MNKTLTTTEARTQLPALVHKVAQAKPAPTLRGNGIPIQARGETMLVLLMPEAAIAAAEEYIASLEAELEDVALMRLLEEREMADTGNRTPLGQVAAELGIELGDS